jgi:hypothetical protein
MAKLIGIILVTFVSIVPYHPAAAGIDRSSPLLCAVIEVFECSLESDCLEVSAESANIPRFIRVDFENMKLTLPEKSEEQRESSINNVVQNNGTLILQGVEGGRGWSIAISENGDKMTGTASEGEGGFAVFGACTLD